MWNVCNFHSRESVIFVVFIAMSEKEVPVSVAQRIIIRFLVKEEVKSAEIYRRLEAQFDSECLSSTQVYEWCSSFRKGRARVENEPHQRRSRTSVNDSNTKAVENIILEDHRVNIRDIAEGIGISVGSVETIMHERLGYRKITARWAPTFPPLSVNGESLTET